MKIKQHLFFAIVLVAGVHAYAARLDLTQRQSVRIAKLVEPAFPRGLLEQGVAEGYASVLLNVSDEGKVTDQLVSAYSRKEFADAAQAVLKEWVFVPASINGQPIAVVTEIQFTFEAGQVLVQMNGSDALNAMFSRMARPDGYRLSTLAEIDRIPVPRVVEAPRYSEEHIKKGQRGQVVFEFVIDETGQVRLPCAVSGDDNELVQLAGAAIRGWQFEPPLRQGRPVAVRARQLFNFEGKPATIAAKP